MITTRIENGQLHISLPLGQGVETSTGKSEIVATTNGFHKTETVYKGFPVTIQVLAIIPTGERAQKMLRKAGTNVAVGKDY